MRLHFPFVAMLVATGCGQSAERAENVATAQKYIDGWDQMGMWLPQQDQIDFFRSHMTESRTPLVTALENPSYSVRMRAAYAIGNMGRDARPLGPGLLERLKKEPDRLVRMYLYDALRDIRYGGHATIQELNQRFAKLDDDNLSPEPGQSRSEYLDADEKIHIAGALYVLDQSAGRKRHLEYILKWLRPPGEELSAKERKALWERRWGAVLALENMPDAVEAKPVLEDLAADADAPSWASVHIPRVISSLK